MPTDRPPPPLHPFLVVGLGASAGGLPALLRFFGQLPAHSGMAFVVVMHLSPSHESHAAEILQRATRMPVQQVTAPLALVPDHVYVIAPGRSLSFAGGLLQPCDEVRVGGVNVAIDSFFRALAEAQRSRAVCVLLSGSGSDGAVGSQRVKELGGVTLAQSPDDAEHPAMPRAAMATGVVDAVLPAAELPAWLMRLADTAAAIRMPADLAADLAADPGAQAEAQADAAADTAGRDGEAALAEIMALLRHRTQHDFRHYKRPTVLRRLQRRMQVTGTPTLAAYRDHLHAHVDETPALLQDMLISVTQFFRDGAAFAALEREVLPGLVAAAAGRPLRAWVVGCASGEEAYTLAMLLQEACERAPVQAVPPFQVFASDIDDRALALARAGSYPEAIVADVSPARLARFFAPQADGLRVVRSLRERVLFAHHNVLQNAPFSRVDLICCRNLLIYLDPRAQATVLELLHFALNPGGVLMVGAAETAEAGGGHFVELDQAHRLFRASARAAAQHRLPMAPLDNRPAAPAGPPGVRLPRRALSGAELHQQARGRHALPSALIDPHGRILHLAESMAPWLHRPDGLPSQLLVDNLQPRLQLALRTALHLQARPSWMTDPARPVSVDADSDSGPVRLTVTPLPDAPDGQALLLVSLQAQPGEPPLPVSAAAGTPGEQLVRQLDADNTRLRQQLAAVITTGETSTQELMSSNEELHALNEELRLATEELQSRREELQSTNEELLTVNTELALKADEARRSSDDLHNLINASDIAIVFVDSELRVQRFTPRATDLFNLIDGDLGRPLQHITHRLPTQTLVQDARQAVDALRPAERELQLPDGRHFIGRVLPYRTGEDRIAGAVLSFIDISALRQAQGDERRGAEQLRLAAESTRDFAILTTDDDGRITSWNRGAERLFGVPAAQMLGQPLALTFTDEDQAAGLPHQELSRARLQGRSEDERWHRRNNGSIFYCSSVTTRLDEGRGFAKIARELSGRQPAAQPGERPLGGEPSGLRDTEAGAASKEVFLAVMSHELKQPLNLIHLNAELLARLPEVRAVPAALRAAQQIQQTVQGQARIVDDLLDLSRARTGKLRLEPAPVDLVDMLRRITGALRPEAQAAGVRLVLETGTATSLRALFDPVRADQVVWNLLRNALKFTPRGGSVRVLLSTEGDALRLTVTDTGRGLAAEDVDRVFDMFSQAGEPAAGNKGGLGIGLALVRELVQAHGGRVQARSDGLGRGAEFSVWVPRHDGLAPAPVSTLAPAPSVLNGLRVLVVDDSADSAITQAQLLALTGAHAQAVCSGAEALACLDGGRFDLLVSDIGMPGMSGLELIAAVRARSDGAQLMALACSGYGRTQDARQAVAAGFDALLPKPASLAQMEQAVAALMQDRAKNPG